MKIIDLHSHSTCSDGTFSPSALLKLAKEAGVDVLALTDHDTILGLAQAKQQAQALGIRLIDGVEISCQHCLSGGYGKHHALEKVIHVVALGFRDGQTLQSTLQAIQDSRENRGRQMVDKLHDVLILHGQTSQTLWQLVLQKALHNPKAVGRAHIAQALVEFGAVKTIQNAFDKYLADGKQAYVAIQTLEMKQTIELIHDCGGLAVLAHPTRYNLSATRVRRLIEDFALMGGDAVELPNNEPLSTRAMIDRCIKAHGLLVSVGSDFHGTTMPWRKLGCAAKPHAEQVGVWERLL